ncbi:hypothetical protein A3K86_21775 [Photobacterium jeanii]|uniref:Uncharacterized protein n=2 Tax=Photobacterium jeanii TaxID=858640 RepID=A0A178K3M6_9GAMM|nr:hypothetical protein A3K86_21775 [Photobacterium jeanii]PST91077.1 hypothetical protein C9I91_10880 [Photobacterium jeanii]
MVRGTQELWAKRPGFLLTILLCGFWFWLILPTGAAIPEGLTQQRFTISPAFLLGGFLFGLGAAINKGCSVSTISKLAKGHYYMLATVAGWIIGWCILTATPHNLSYTSLASLSTPSAAVIVMLFILICGIFFIVPPEKRAILLGIVLFGILASILTWLLPEWSPSQLLKDLTATLVHRDNSFIPSLQRFLVIACLIVGMALGAKSRLSLTKFELRPSQLAKHMIAGLIMGIGASLALGGNDSQLLLALPSFSPAGAASIAMIIVGISCGMGLRRLKHKISSHMPHNENRQ